MLRVSNGPTLAFKDIALQLLGNLFEYELEHTGRTLNVLGATSGDTGSSAEYAMRGKHRVNVFMLSPHGRMSPFQQAQMYALDEPNIFNLAVRGTFDECQDLVKRITGDAIFKSRHRIGAVNSINWARVAAQVVYYFKGYFAATARDDEPVAFAVPSGNFGNILAGHVAREMGLPIGALILATNENDVLHEFFRTGTYRPRSAAQTHSTSSPSMDISRASNFERFIFDALGRDAARTRALFAEVETKRSFGLDAGERARIASFGFVSGKSTGADRLATIRAVHDRFGEVIDPHTADALHVGRAHADPAVPMIVLETALAAKFNATVRAAIGRDAPRPARLAGLEELPRRFTTLPKDGKALMAYIAEND